MATTYLTQTTTAGSMVQWTWSAWVKRSGISTEQNIFTGYNAATDYTEVRFDASDRLNFQNRVASSIAGELQTRRVFRDTSGWYNIVIVWDTGNGVAGDRMKMYVNGVQETDFIGVDNPTLNKDSNIGEASVPTHIGSFATGSNFFDGSMSYVCFIDGQALTASSFGETDATTGEWKIKAIASGGFTWGANGYMILKNGDTITDQSTNSNNFTLGGGTLTNTEDCPSDVFCTLNPLAPITSGSLSYGNTRIVGTVSSAYGYNTVGSLGDSKGKYYCEIKYTVANANTNCTVGVVNLNNHESNVNTTSATGGYVAFRLDGYKFINGSSTAGYWATPTAGDIVMIALDMDNLKVWVGLNGSWYGTTGNTDGNPATGANPSATITAGVFSPVNIRHLAGTFDCNFGNGYFGTTIISSAGTNASNIGIFEHDVPTGYTAISTKGLNS